MPEQFRPTTATEYHVEQGVGLVIDGKPFPWYVAEEGPMVEALDPDLPMHILWVPIFAEGHAPRAGRPEGERVEMAEAKAEAAEEIAHEIRHSVAPNHPNTGYRDGHEHAAWVAESLGDAYRAARPHDTETEEQR